jgi:hypothetical protein
MSTSPASPRVSKGALVTLEDTGTPRSVIAFQYNPDTLTRSLQAMIYGGDYGQPVAVYGPPVETISFDAEIDASDQLADGNVLVGQVGILPVLSALELLLYPTLDQVLQDGTSAATGGHQFIPQTVPLTLLIWGRSRILPVELRSFTITEEAFDSTLNPIRARVQFQLRVLSYIDLGLDSPGGSLFVAHQVTKEALARRNYLSAGVNGVMSVLFPGTKGRSTL